MTDKLVGSAAAMDSQELISSPRRPALRLVPGNAILAKRSDDDADGAAGDSGSGDKAAPLPPGHDVGDGCGARMKQLLELHWIALERVALKLARGNKAVAQDLFGDTHLKAWGQRHRYQDRGFGRSWLSRICLRAFLDWRRRESHFDSSGKVPDVPGPDPDELSWWIDLDMSLVLAAAEELPPDLRECFLLFHVDGVPGKEIAALLDISQVLVGVRCLKARRRLGEILTRRFGPPGSGGKQS